MSEVVDRAQDADPLTALACRARDGDRGAATELVRQTYQQVWRAMVVLSSRADAEDLTQETFARAFRSLPGFRAEASARTWLLSIARRVAADNIRTARVRPRTDPLGDDEELPRQIAPELDETIALHALVDQLHPDRRTAFLLTQVSGLSYEEAAQVCDCPVGTIRSRVARARGDLAAALAADGSTGPTHPTARRRLRQA
jgi:RNA polymerase sigma-70 factor (ECF subfamily)